jgi:hypothetical protein
MSKENIEKEISEISNRLHDLHLELDILNRIDYRKDEINQINKIISDLDKIELSSHLDYKVDNIIANLKDILTELWLEYDELSELKSSTLNKPICSVENANVSNIMHNFMEIEYVEFNEKRSLIFDKESFDIIKNWLKVDRTKPISFSYYLYENGYAKLVKIDI